MKILIPFASLRRGVQWLYSVANITLILDRYTAGPAMGVMLGTERVVLL